MRLLLLLVFYKYLNTPISIYIREDEQEAYINPSISSYKLLLWTVHDDIGICQRERESMAGIAEITDQGVWWDDESGKMTTVWSMHEKQVEQNVLQGTPLWERKVHY